MAVMAVQGLYRHDKVELLEKPAGVEGTSRVLVVFVPSADALSASPSEETDEEREAIVARIVADMREGIDFGGRPYSKREGLYDRLHRWDR